MLFQRIRNCCHHDLTNILTVFFCRLIDIDSFVAALWKVHVAVAKEGYAQVHFVHFKPQAFADACRTWL